MHTGEAGDVLCRSLVWSGGTSRLGDGSDARWGACLRSGWRDAWAWWAWVCVAERGALGVGLSDEEKPTVGRDAVRDLRVWQRAAAGAQEQALRAALKAARRVEALDGQRASAVEVLVSSLEALEATGVSRDQADELLGLEVGALVARRPRGARATRPAQGSSA